MDTLAGSNLSQLQQTETTHFHNQQYSTITGISEVSNEAGNTISNAINCYGMYSILSSK